MKNIQIIFNALRSLSFTKIIKLLRLTLPHPLFSIMGFYATLRSFTLAQKHFPKTHSNNGEGNAFRHSLWTCLIMMYCCKISSPQKALEYCKKMTDLHEELFPNKPLETKMDLHNNQVGMNYFMELLPGVHRQFFETSFFVKGLLDKTKTAKVLKSLDDDFKGELVYLK
ncbi:hypothetical protein Q73A0000_12920 [Kaistella flava (ex Peng et al. 2021)]|uniref:DUF6973 domain-containing protein n=1 Tax=Kaistella flava (ex Peng et al. 2021) TaxID=2038776 RepID=A0A7M2YCT7_9FLAO|nr:hypothetical protein [Kaistella flava (ex Peng et al. 2021)]QOW11193.1 hypothetical protein Q73A0000_12920 [Kaistella flava (ex Peng et al. 2021)]